MKAPTYILTDRDIQLKPCPWCNGCLQIEIDHTPAHTLNNGHNGTDTNISDHWHAALVGHADECPLNTWCYQDEVFFGSSYESEEDAILHVVSEWNTRQPEKPDMWLVDMMIQQIERDVNRYDEKFWVDSPGNESQAWIRGILEGIVAGLISGLKCTLDEALAYIKGNKRLTNVPKHCFPEPWHDILEIK